MRKHVETTFKDWWGALADQDVLDLHSLASDERWFQFDFARRLVRETRAVRPKWRVRCEAGLGQPDIRITDEASRAPLPPLEIECKVIWNNKNIWASTDSAIYDARRLAARGAPGYLMLLVAFYNRHDPANGLNSAFCWSKRATRVHPARRIQPLTPNDPFPPFAAELWKYVTDHIQRECGLGPVPRLSMKYEGWDAWVGGLLWEVC